MVFWRGWGILGILIPALVALAFLGIASSLKLESGLVSAMAGVGLTIGGVGGWFVGQHMNVEKPKADLEGALAARQQRYAQLVSAGQFSRGPEFPRPQSMADAQAQAAQQLAEDRAILSKNLTNRHTLYFVPFQWIAAIAGGLGLVIAVAAVVI